jgi:hypothetical protein
MVDGKGTSITVAVDGVPWLVPEVTLDVSELPEKLEKMAMDWPHIMYV